MAMWAGHAGLVFLFALCSSLFSGRAPAFNTNLYFVLHHMIPPVMPYRCGDCGFRTPLARGIAGGLHTIPVLLRSENHRAANLLGRGRM
jgi:hypothetical protein